ncbi:MAG: hypothetical protein ACRD01_11170 [Terriglobales bacterium]
MPRSFHSTLILVIVFAFGLAAGVSGMVWAWPGVHQRYMRPRHQTLIQRLTKSLNLTPTQVPQVQALFNDTRNRRHQIYVQFYPQYSQACGQFNQAMSAISHQERQAFEPTRQQENRKLQSLLTPQQWQKYQAALASHQRQRRDPCRLPPLTPPAANHAGHPQR